MGIPRTVRKYLAAIARKGGRARVKPLTAKQRRALARKAARARWGKKRAR